MPQPVPALIVVLIVTALAAAWLAGWHWVRRSRWEARIAAAKAERASLAREMHDSLSKTLDALALGAAALPSTLDAPDRAAKLAQTLHDGSLTAVRETRALIEGLRARTSEAPLPELLAAAGEEWQAATGVPVTVRAAADVPVDADLVPEIVEIVREALRNVALHAGARHVGVSLQAVRGETTLTIADDGRGGAGQSHPGRYGLIGMAERARLAGGQLEVRSPRGGGTVVLLRFPVHPAPKPYAARVLAVSSVALLIGATALAATTRSSAQQGALPLPVPSLSPSVSPSAAPSPVPSASAPAKSTPSPAAKKVTVPDGQCRVQYTIREQWNNGFTVDLSITNLADAPVNGWSLVFTFPNQKLLSAWDATAAQNGQTVIVSDGGRKPVIAAGATITFGLQGTWQEANPVPAEFLLNQRRCVQ